MEELTERMYPQVTGISAALHRLPRGVILHPMPSTESEPQPLDAPVPRVVVALCTYNERDNLRELIPEIRRILSAADVLVVDDNSPDGTGELLAELSRTDPRVQFITRAGKLGLGTAIVEALKQGCERGYDYVINMDADFSHPPRYLPDLVAAMPSADVAIGSRYVAGGKIVGWPWTRKVMSRLINAYARLMLGLSTRDNSGSYRCYRAEKLKLIPWKDCRAKGYAFLEEILFRCKRAGCRFVEVPITFEERRHGSSKINWKEAVIAVWVLFRLRFTR
jgi:dolichol-phosphate mannosyltransferase